MPPVPKVELYAAIRRDARAGMSARAIERKYRVTRHGAPAPNLLTASNGPSETGDDERHASTTMHLPLRPAIARPRQKTQPPATRTGRRRRGPSCRIPRQRHAVANEFLLGLPPWHARPDSVGAPRRAEQAGDFGDGLVAGLDVPHDGARGLVPGLGHDQLQRDLLVPEVSRRRVAELMEFQATARGGGGVLLEQDPGAVVAQAG